MAKLVKKADSASPSLPDLEALQQEGAVVMVGTEEIRIRPFTFGQLLKALKHLAHLGTSINDEDGELGLVRALTDNSDDVLGLLMLSTGKNKEFFDTLSAEAGIDLAIATYKVNKDFFARTLTPKLSQLGLSLDSQSDQKNSEAPAQAENQTPETGSTSSSN